jgi:hypothetical protein
MTKLITMLFCLSALNLPAVSAQQSVKPAPAGIAADKKDAKKPFKLPAEIKVILIVEEMPGIENSRSFWEGVYEIRVADWHTIVERGNAGNVEASGVAVLQSSFSRRSFSIPDNRIVTVSVPVTGALLERLQQQPQTPQALLINSTVRIFDAQLDRNYAFKVNRIWRFKLFPDGEATIALKIKQDGSFSIWGPIPKEMPPGYSIVGVPPTSKP